MTNDIEGRLLNMNGKVREINGYSRYDIHKDALLPYWNRAYSIRSSALVIWHAYNDNETTLRLQMLGLEEDSPVKLSLPPIFFT